MNLAIWIPDAFSPNADGKNDFLKILSNRSLDLRWTIYDSWGNLVYFSQNDDEGWNGECQGSPCPPGAYAWKAEYRPQGATTIPYEMKRGVVLILR